jgi:MFS family permease
MTSFYGAWSSGGILGALEASGTGAAGWSLTASLAPVAIVPLLVAAGRFLPVAVAGGAPRSSGVSVAVPSIPWRAMSLLGLAIVLFYIADSATSSWSTIYLSDVLLAGAGAAPLGYAAYQATSLVSRLAGDHLVRRVGPVAVVRLAALVGTIGLLAVVLARTPWLAIAGFAVLGIGIAVVAPLTFAAAGRLASVDADGAPVTSETARRAASDAIIARINQFNYLGFVLGGVLTGLVASGSGMREGFVVPLVGIVLILPLARVFAARRALGR